MNAHIDKAIDAHFDSQLNAYLAELDNQDAEQVYLEDLERELKETGIEIGKETFCIADAELDWFEGAEFDTWNQEMVEADIPRRRELIREFEKRKQDWIRNIYVPQLAEKLRQEYETSCFGWECAE